MFYNNETGIYFDIRRMYDVENGKRFKIEVHIPMSLGWIEDVKFVVMEEYRERMPNYYSLFHKENFKDMACFETEVEMKNSIYGFAFCFKANGNFRYLKQKNLTSNNQITFEECWKLRVEWLPEWVRGRIMCHLFANDATINEFDQKILFYQDKGKWSIRFMGKNMSVESFFGDLKRRKVSLVYVTHVKGHHSFEKMGDALRLMCYVAHKWGIYVILDYPDLSGLNHLYTLGVDVLDTVGQFRPMSTEIMWQ